MKKSVTFQKHENTYKATLTVVTEYICNHPLSYEFHTIGNEESFFRDLKENNVWTEIKEDNK